MRDLAARGRRRWALVAVALVTTAWVAAGVGVRATYGARTTADEPQYLLSALSLAEDGDLDIADERYEARYRAFHEPPLPPQDALGPDGRRLSPHGPLLPALLAAPVAAGGWLGAKLALAVTAGLLAAVTAWVAAVRFGVRLAVAVVATLAFSLAAPMAVYGTQVYPEVPAALAVAAGAGAATGRLGRRGRLALAGAVIVLPWLSVKYAPVAATLAVVALVRLARSGSRRAALALAATLAVAGVAHVAFHQTVYGGFTPYAAGTHFRAGELTVAGTDPDLAGRAPRLAGLLLDAGFGLAAWQPGWLLAVPALAALARRRPPGWAVLAAPLAAGWLTATFAALTMHGWWWPGRQVVVVLPLAVVAVAWWADRWARGPALLLAALVAGASTFAVVVAEGLAGRLTWVVDFEATVAPAVRALRPLLPDYRAPGPATWARQAAWLVALGAAAVVAARARPPGPAHVRQTYDDPVGSPNSWSRQGDADARADAPDRRGPRPRPAVVVRRR